MNKLFKRSIFAILNGFILITSLTACRSITTSNVPVIPVKNVADSGGVVRISLPITIHHSHFQYIYYDEQGSSKWETKAVEIFPTDVFISYASDSQTVSVFLARSPHMGCLMNWNLEMQTFEDPCFGSRFALDGSYESGPAPRSLDELPAEIKDGMIWVKNEVVYGQDHP